MIIEYHHYVILKRSSYIFKIKTIFGLDNHLKARFSATLIRLSLHIKSAKFNFHQWAEEFYSSLRASRAIRLKVVLFLRVVWRLEKSDYEIWQWHKCLTDERRQNSCLLVEYTCKDNLTVKSVYYSSHSLIGPFPNSSHAHAQPVSMVRYSRWKTVQECKDYSKKEKNHKKSEKNVRRKKKIIKWNNLATD